MKWGCRAGFRPSARRALQQISKKKMLAFKQGANKKTVSLPLRPSPLLRRSFYWLGGAIAVRPGTQTVGEPCRLMVDARAIPIGRLRKTDNQDQTATGTLASSSNNHTGNSKPAIQRRINQCEFPCFLFCFSNGVNMKGMMGGAKKKTKFQLKKEAAERKRKVRGTTIVRCSCPALSRYALESASIPRVQWVSWRNCNGCYLKTQLIEDVFLSHPCDGPKSIVTFASYRIALTGRTAKIKR